MDTEQGIAGRALARARVEAARRRDRVRQVRLLASLSVVALLAGFTVAFVTSPEEFSDDAFGQLMAGQLERQDALGEWHAVAVGEDVPYGHTIRTSAISPARLDVRQGIVEFGPDTVASTLPGTVEVARGEVLFDVRAFYLGLSANLVARGDGMWRLDAADNARVAVYRGSASATTGIARGQVRPEARSLRDYEEIGLVAGAVGEVGPLRYGPDDEWDVQYAAELLAIDDAVAATANGVRGTYGVDPRDQDFYEAFTVVDDGIELALDRFDVLPGAGFGPPAEVLTAVLTARLLVDRAGLAFDQAVEEIDSRRADGATWGIVLARRDLGVADWVRAVDLSLREIEELGDDAPPTITPAPAPSPSPSPSPTPTDEPTESPTELPTDEPTEQPTEEPTERPTEIPSACTDPPPNAPTCVEETVDLLLDTIDDLIPPLPRIQSGDAAEGGLLDGVADLLGMLLLSAGAPRGSVFWV